MSDEISATGAGDLAPVSGRTLYLAKWSTRFWAWLLDVILMILFLNIVKGIFVPFWKLPLLWDFLWDFGHIDIIALGIESLFFFAYWIVIWKVIGASQSARW